MKIKTKIASLLLFAFIPFSFSGCSIRKKEEIKTPDIKVEIKGKEKTEKIDTDKDGLTDLEENEIGTNKNRVDTDSDGLTDFEEVKKWKTDPLNSDTDGDGYFDGHEIEGGYNPLGLGQLDSDNDGIGDADEKKIGTNPNK